MVWWCCFPCQRRRHHRSTRLSILFDSGTDATGLREILFSDRVLLCVYTFGDDRIIYTRTCMCGFLCAHYRRLVWHEFIHMFDSPPPPPDMDAFDSLSCVRPSLFASDTLQDALQECQRPSTTKDAPECLFCYESTHHTSFLTCGQCHRVFHKACWVQWLLHKNKKNVPCPSCDAFVSTVDNHHFPLGTFFIP